MEKKKEVKAKKKEVRMGGFDNQCVRFDWAIKRLLRQKANFGVLEGFLTVLLGEKVTILEILESESNQLYVDDKFNRVDIKAKNSKGEIIIGTDSVWCRESRNGAHRVGAKLRDGEEGVFD